MTTSLETQMKVATMPTSPTHATGKRKRSQGSEGAENSKGDDRKEQFDVFLQDLYAILKEYDTTPSILDLPSASVLDEDRSSKRKKTSAPPGRGSIASRIRDKAYHNIEELARDVEDSSQMTLQAQTEQLKAEDGSQFVPQPESKVESRTSKLLEKFEEIVRHELAQRPYLLGIGREMATPIPKEAAKAEREPLSPPLGRIGKTVLTLFGGAPIPRQLFSSLPVSCGAITADGTVTQLEPGETDTTNANLQEISLPNGISTTKLLPVHSSERADSKEKPPVLGEVFVSSNIASLSPPKYPRHSASRGSSSWYNPLDIATSKSRGKEHFPNQVASSGQWLMYSAAPTASQLAIAAGEERRKYRNIDPDHDGSREEIPLEFADLHAAMDEEASFKRAFSGFAPVSDNAGSLIPHGVKSQVWWNRSGRSRFEHYLDSFDQSRIDDNPLNTNSFMIPASEGDNAMIEEAVQSWEPEEMPKELIPTKSLDNQAPAEKDVDELLVEISELLETLYSHQQIRNSSLPVTRTSAGQATETSRSSVGAVPSEDEVDVYNMLKSQLTLIISDLPPSAVARLDGDRLQALNISTKLIIEGSDTKGTMEDVEIRVRQQIGGETPSSRASAAHVSTSRSSQHQNTTTPARGNYGTANPRSAPVSNYAGQPSVRPGISGSQHAPYGSQTGSYRKSYSQYGAQTPSGAAVHNSNGTRSYSGQNGLGSYGSQSGGVSGTSSMQLPPQRSNPTGYQPRTQNINNYGSYNPTTAFGRSASPQNPSTNPSHVRGPYVGSPPNSTAARSQYSPPAGTNRGLSSANAAAVLINGANTVGQHLGLTAEEQAMLMQRQKHQIQQQMHSATKQSRGLLASGESGEGKRNRTPTPEIHQNGVTAGSTG